MALLLLALGLTHTHNLASKFEILNPDVCSLKIHLVEVLLELGKVREIKSGSTIKIERENKKDKGKNHAKILIRKSITQSRTINPRMTNPRTINPRMTNFWMANC